MKNQRFFGTDFAFVGLAPSALYASARLTASGTTVESEVSKSDDLSDSPQNCLVCLRVGRSIADVNWATWFASCEMYVRRHGALVEVQAPAKLNLFLEVLARRNDGFHEIETLMVPICAHDTLRLSPTSGQTIQLDCRLAAGGVAADAVACHSVPTDSPPAQRETTTAVPGGADNLVHRALECLRQSAGIEHGVRAQLTKRIPAAAGLGGGSSDAAAALLAGNEFWQLGWTVKQLSELAATIGSDVPFFLSPGAAICRGRGERIEPLGGIPAMHVVVAKPAVGLSTPEVYRHCRPAEQPHGVAALVSAIRSGCVAGLRKHLFNRLQEAAEELTPWIGRLRIAFDQAGCDVHQMSGSGSSYFGICRHASQARRVAGRLRAAGWGYVLPSRTMPLIYRHA